MFIIAFIIIAILAQRACFNDQPDIYTNQYENRPDKPTHENCSAYSVCLFVTKNRPIKAAVTVPTDNLRLQRRLPVCSCPGSSEATLAPFPRPATPWPAQRVGVGIVPPPQPAASGLRPILTAAIPTSAMLTCPAPQRRPTRRRPSQCSLIVLSPVPLSLRTAKTQGRRIASVRHARRSGSSRERALALSAASIQVVANDAINLITDWQCGRLSHGTASVASSLPKHAKEFIAGPSRIRNNEGVPRMRQTI